MNNIGCYSVSTSLSLSISIFTHPCRYRVGLVKHFRIAHTRRIYRKYIGNYYILPSKPFRDVDQTSYNPYHKVTKFLKAGFCFKPWWFDLVRMAGKPTLEEDLLDPFCPIYPDAYKPPIPIYFTEQDLAKTYREKNPLDQEKFNFLTKFSRFSIPMQFAIKQFHLMKKYKISENEAYQKVEELFNLYRNYDREYLRIIQEKISPFGSPIYNIHDLFNIKNEKKDYSMDISEI